jgi:chaperone BCS1
MDIVFDQTFAVKGEDMPIKLAFKDIIFVMEDVDAASPIVHARSEGSGSSKSDDPAKAASVKKLIHQASTSAPDHKASVSSDNNELTDIDTAAPPALLPAAPGEDADLVKAMLLSLSDDSDSKKKVVISLHDASIITSEMLNTFPCLRIPSRVSISSAPRLRIGSICPAF